MNESVESWEESARERRRAAPLAKIASIAAIVCLVGLASGCKKDPPSLEEACASPISGALNLDEWKEETLSYNRGICSARYSLRTPASGELRVSVYAPTGEGLPSYSLELEDGNGTIISRAEASRKSPKRINKNVKRSEYFLVVRLSGESPEDLAVSISPEFSRGGPAPTPQPIPRPRQPEVEPEPEPEPTIAWILADVLKQERKDGRAFVVVLASGTRDGVRQGASGELVNPDGQSLANIEVIEVSEDACRARIRGDLQGWITPRTSARIRP